MDISWHWQAVNLTYFAWLCLIVSLGKVSKMSCIVFLFSAKHAKVWLLLNTTLLHNCKYTYSCKNNTEESMYSVPDLPQWWHWANIDIDAVKIEDISVTTRIPCVNSSPFLSLPSLEPGHHKCIFSFYNVIVLRTLYKQNHIVCNILRLILFTPHDPSKVLHVSIY